MVNFPGGGGVTSIGGRTRRSREKKRVKGVSKSGVGAEREKGFKNANIWTKWYPNRYDQNTSHAIKCGKGRYLKTTCRLILDFK